MTQQPGSDGSWRDWYRGDQQPGASPQDPGQAGGTQPYGQPGYPQAPQQPTPYAQDPYAQSPAYGAPGQHGYPAGHQGQPGHHPGYSRGADYYQQTAAWHQHTAAISQGQSHATTALICGILGFFVVGFILGPVAIVQAKKAQQLGADATPGLILGWIVTVIYAAMILFFGLLILLGIIGAATS